MALNIRNREAETLAERLAALTGETKTAAVTRALRERLERLQREGSGTGLADSLDAIALRTAASHLHGHAGGDLHRARGTPR